MSRLFPATGRGARYEAEDGERMDDDDRALLDLSKQGTGSPVTIEELMADDLLEAAAH